VVDPVAAAGIARILLQLTVIAQESRARCF
jgi:hypothetical protein